MEEKSYKVSSQTPPLWHNKHQRLTEERDKIQIPENTFLFIFYTNSRK